MSSNLKILALDTSTEACSAAVWADRNVVERFETGNQHSDLILPMVQAVLAEAGLALTQLDAIAFGRGPGSFTGLRIGAGVAQGLAFGADRPVIPVSSLAALAQSVDAPRVLVAFDARMGQVYFGAYARTDRGLVEPIGAEQVVAPAEIPLPEGTDWVGAGSGWDQYHALLSARLGKHVAGWQRQGHPRARFVAELAIAAYRVGQTVTAEQALPVYLRDEIAVKRSKP
ncbi:MAG TPA: tRNA (adenosine(37)-N6)-threonylcarbamoyltransferase complex dimerization subunit type 1 TsaB [Pseudolabrys sp.]|nr:tRNA (adenosine(37)-N6)-threonylcarbamoyltransferase complex dimerization subunit type 1 TsaB [Pseudolabrys sp.]